MNVLVLTGAGISAESGIPTFRDANGLWEGHAFEDVASPQGFSANPDLVHHFYNQRRRALLNENTRPNAAHLALAEFERHHHESGRGAFLLVTQNIDDLHQRAGSRNLLAMHGELLKARCSLSGVTFSWREDLSVETPHPEAPDDVAKRGCLRPHVVWFGEMPIGLERIAAAAAVADVFIAIGTSGLVYPAAGIVSATPSSCRRIEVNLANTPASEAFQETIRGAASEQVPKLLQRLIAQ